MPALASCLFQNMTKKGKAHTIMISHYEMDVEEAEKKVPETEPIG